jgi:outer membrane protein OmpA-like peptidoglycan-associated protein
LKNLLLIILILLSQLLSAQNLLPNGSFEDMNYCVEFNQPCSMEGWNMFIMRNTHVRMLNKKEAHSGKAYVAATILNIGGAAKTFLETPIICPLQKNKEYKLHLFIQIADKHIHPLQVFFSNQNYLAHWVNFFDSIPTIQISESNLIYPQKIEPYKWLEFETKFIANGNEKYFVLGNFNRIETDEYTGHHKYSRNGEMYYLFDDVSLMADDSSVCSNYENNLQEIYRQDFRHSFWNDVSDELGITSLVDSVNIQPNQVVDSVLFTQQIDTLTLPEILFEIDSFTINPEFINVLDSFCNSILISNFESIQINGFTDNTGNEKHNIELSINRAKSIFDYLVLVKQIDNQKLSFNGFGSQFPKADNTTIDGRTKNRRVEIILFR